MKPSALRAVSLMGLALSAGLLHAPTAHAADAAVIKLTAPEILGSLNLDKTRLTAIKTAIERALDGPIDAEQQCGAVQLDCVVRAARQWTVDNTKYRLIVVNLHTVGHANIPVPQVDGKWASISAD